MFSHDAETRFGPTTKPVIKRWDISSLDDEPNDPTCFSELFMFEIGPDDSPGADWFDLKVVTPSWLVAQFAAGAPYFFTRDMLVVERWDPDRVVQAMQGACDAVPEVDWKTISEYLNGYTSHEYDVFRLKVDQRMPEDALQPEPPPSEVSL
jgi:hypothetical protein